MQAQKCTQLCTVFAAYLLHHSIVTTYCHTDTMVTVPFSLDVLHHCILFDKEIFSEVKFRKARLKYKYGVNLVP